MVCKDGTSVCEKDLDVMWYFNFTNGESSNFYFGADQSSVFLSSAVFLVLNLLLVCHMLYVRHILINMRKYHLTVKLMFGSVLCSFARVAIDLLYFSEFRATGKSNKTWSIIGTVFASMADFLMVLTFMLLMKGWTIVRRKISANGRTRLTCFFLLYISVYWSCWIYYQYGIDRALVVYVFDSWPGYVLISLRIVLALWILRAYFVLRSKYEVKKGFYKKFTALTFVWVVSVPLMVLINYMVAEYMRFKIIYAFELSVNFITQSVIVSMYNPKSILFGSSFPFHATTTAMLLGRSGTNKSQRTGLSDTQLRQATEISRRIKRGVIYLQSFANDLLSFLEEVDPAEEELLNNDEDLPGMQSSDMNIVSNKKRRCVEPRGVSLSEVLSEK
jgi:hypothetical protein